MMMPALPEFSKSATSTPIPARAFPSALKASPASTATSLNFPSCKFLYNLFGCVSLATSRSGQPSWSQSNIATPSDFELLSNTPLEAVTSSNVPFPRFRYSQQVSPRYASGVQYDLFFPSRLQNTSCSADQRT